MTRRTLLPAAALCFALLLAKTFVYESLLHAGLISRETGAAIAGMPPDLNTETPNPDVELEKI